MKTKYLRISEFRLKSEMYTFKYGDHEGESHKIWELQKKRPPFWTLEYISQINLHLFDPWITVALFINKQQALENLELCKSYQPKVINYNAKFKITPELVFPNVTYANINSLNEIKKDIKLVFHVHEGHYFVKDELGFSSTQSFESFEESFDCMTAKNAFKETIIKG